MPELRKAPVTAIEELTERVFLLKVRWERPEVKPGQFYMLGVEGKQLPRPISLCDLEDDTLVFCIEAVGEGTKRMRRLNAGDIVPVTGPLGNGFDMEALNNCKKAALVSGGAGIAPFVYLNRAIKCSADSFCGFADEPYLTEKLINPRISTDSGRFGAKGFVTSLFNVSDYDMIAACGNDAMLRAVGKLCADAGVPCQLSMDTYMACGVGACLTCACKTKNGFMRCCADGPVFWASDFSF